MVFPTTLPLDEPELDRVSDFAGWLEVQREHRADPGGRAALPASLWQDLRPQPGPHGRTPWGDVVTVVAASLRHVQALAIYLRCRQHIVPLTVFPQQRLAHSPLEQEQFDALPLSQLTVVHVEPALLRPPQPIGESTTGEARRCVSLTALGWTLALHGPRAEVLPALSGSRACRRVPGMRLDTPRLAGAMAAAVQRLEREAASLRTIAGWPGMDADRAARMLNGLYLQGALIVSRTHPAAHAG
ncbi:MAG: hypothetical protein RI988_2523 [Pseudomonadota bacterium]|jgi:hypothetical protein